MQLSRLQNSGWTIFIFIGLMSQMIISILFFYPLYTNFVTREPVQILFMQFHEPLEAVLLGEMALCVLSFITAAVVMFFYARKLKRPRF